MTLYHDNPNDTGLRGPVPRDARLIALILSSMGVSDVEPAVLLQLLEFAHRYTYDVLSDALVYSDHANSRQAGSNLSLDDVNLAIQSRVNHSFTKPPEKDMLLGLATTVNSIPLPPISDRHGVRLPPPQHCLTNVNFQIVPNPPPQDFDDFEESLPQPTASTSSFSASAAAGKSNVVGMGETGADASQSTSSSAEGSAAAGTQTSSLFDTNSQLQQQQQAARRSTQHDEDYDDNDEDEKEEGAGDVDDDDDVSMTTVHPSQSQSQTQAQKEGAKQEEAEGTGTGRGVKRSLDEDEEYD